MVQTRHTRWPSLAEARTFLPGGTPALPLGLPPGAVLAGWDLERGFPVLRVDPDVPPGSTYVFLFGDLVGGAGIPQVNVDKWLGRSLRLVGTLLRRVLVALNLPLAWTAPQPDPSPNYVPGGRMTQPLAKPRLPIPGGVRVVHKCTISGQAVYMTHGVLMTGPPTVAHLQALADGARTAFQLRIVPNLNTLCIFQETSVQDLSAASASSAVATSGAAGTVATAPAPLSTAAIVQWRTARAGRSFRGRTFHAPLAVNQLGADGRSLPAPVLSDLASRWNGYRTDLAAIAGANGAVIAVLSEVLGVGTPVTSVTIASVVGTQRGRLR